MFLITLVLLSYILAEASVAGQNSTAAHPTDLSASITSFATTASATCCWLISNALRQVLWYNGSVEVTIATISTVVYQYDDIATTTYETVLPNNSQSLPTGIFNRHTFSGIPTDIIKEGKYFADTSLVFGTEFTDPYGKVYTSPTPVWVYHAFDYATGAAKAARSSTCLDYIANEKMTFDLKIYPTGFYIADDTFSRPDDEVFVQMPEELRDWIISHPPPPNDTRYPTAFDWAQCSLGDGIGVPVAHIPVNALTENFETTITMTGNLDGLSVSRKSTTELQTRQTATQISVTSVAATVIASISTPSRILATQKLPSISELVTGTTNTPLQIQDSIISDAEAVSLSDSIVALSPPIPSVTVNSDISVALAASTETTVFETSGSGTATVDRPDSLVSAVATSDATKSTSRQTPVPPALSSPSIILASSTLTLNSASAIVVGSQTLTPGGVVTASGETISLETGGATVVVLDGKRTSTKGLGGIIDSIGGFSGAGAGSETGGGDTAPSQVVVASSSSPSSFTSFEIWATLLAGCTFMFV